MVAERLLIVWELLSAVGDTIERCSCVSDEVAGVGAEADRAREEKDRALAELERLRARLEKLEKNRSESVQPEATDHKR